MNGNYKACKVRLKHIIRRSKDIKMINNVVNRAHLLTIHVYQFLRLWILSLDKVPEITEEVFHMAWKTLSESTTGPPLKGDNAELYETFLQFYNTVYSKLNYENKIPALNLSAISGYICTTMKTALENNIKQHYSNHVRRFVNSYWKITHKEEYQRIANKKLKAEKKKVLDHELKLLKNDIFNHTLTTPKKYHSWIKLHRPNICPEKYKNNIKSCSDPQKYLKCLIYMSKNLETRERKQFQIFPLRHSLIPAYITLDTKALIELFSDNKGQELKQVSEQEHKIWNKTFKLKYKVFKRKNFTFNHTISSNGYNAVIIFIPNSEYEINKQMKKKRVEAIKAAKKLYKGKTPQEIKTIKAEKQKIRNKLKEEKMQEYQNNKIVYTCNGIKNSGDNCLFQVNYKNEYCKMHNSQDIRTVEEIEEDNRVYENSKVVPEFKRLENLTIEEKKEYESSPGGIIDMGKIRIITMLNKKNNKVFKYSNKEYLKRTKRLEIIKRINKVKYNLGILKMEKGLSECSTKTTVFEKFEKCLRIRNSSLFHLTKLYSAEEFRKYEWHSYINKLRTQDKLANCIKNFLTTKKEDKPILTFGDWSANYNMKGLISTPGIGLKRYLASKFKVYDIDEFRTSKLNCKTGNVNGNLYLPDKEGKSHKIHSVLTYKMENNRLGCINRDKNAVYNMKEIVKSILETGKYPTRFLRCTKLKTADLSGDCDTLRSCNPAHVVASNTGKRLFFKNK